MSVVSSSLSGWNPSPLAWHKRPFMILPLFKLQSHFTICPHMFSAFQPDWPAVSPKAPALSRLDALEHNTSSYNLYLLIFFFNLENLSSPRKSHLRTQPFRYPTSEWSAFPPISQWCVCVCVHIYRLFYSSVSFPTFWKRLYLSSQHSQYTLDYQSHHRCSVKEYISQLFHCFVQVRNNLLCLAPFYSGSG